MLKIKKIDIIICFLYIAIFKTYAVPQVLQQLSKITMLAVVLLFIISHIPYKRLINLSILMVVSIILSGMLSYKRGYIAFDKLMDGTLYAICIYCIYTVMQYCYQIQYMDRLINILYKLTVLYCIISFISILLEGTSIYGTEMKYFFGNKFETSYLYIMLVGFYFIKYKDKIDKFFKYKIIYCGLCIATFFLCAWINCGTVMIGSLFLLIAIFIPKHIQIFMMCSKVIIFFVLITGVCIFAMDLLVSNTYIQYLITELMGKSLDLTGRLHIYDYLLNIISESKWFGYGYNNNIIIAYLGYGNAQNGLMELIINYGMIGTVVILFVLGKSCNLLDKTQKLYGAYAIVYVMIICSIVEISYNYVFFIAVFLIRWSKNNNEIIYVDNC